jgi:hypothetical protein
MSETIIFNKTFSDKNIPDNISVLPSNMSLVPGFLERGQLKIPTILPKKAQKEFTVTIPDNLQFRRVSFVALPQSTRGCVVDVEKQPKIGASGKVKIKVSYTIPPNGNISVRLRIYAEATPQSDQDTQVEQIKELHLVNSQSIERLGGYMRSKKRVAFVISGEDAVKLISTGLFGNGAWRVELGPAGPVVKINPTWEMVAIVGILAGAAVSALAISCLTAIIFWTISYNYKISIKEASTGKIRIGDWSLELAYPALVLDLEPA